MSTQDLNFFFETFISQNGLNLSIVNFNLNEDGNCWGSVTIAGDINELIKMKNLTNRNILGKAIMINHCEEIQSSLNGEHEMNILFDFNKVEINNYASITDYGDDRVEEGYYSSYVPQNRRFRSQERSYDYDYGSRETISETRKKRITKAKRRFKRLCKRCFCFIVLVLCIFIVLLTVTKFLF